MKVKDISKLMVRPLITIRENETTNVAIEKLLEHNIGALPVCDARGLLVGIVSEKDLLRICCLHSKKVPGTKVKDIMTREVATCVPDDDLSYIMDVMSRKSIRHLPIMVDAKLAGIISVRDVIEARLDECQFDVSHLKNYISGGCV